MVGLFLCLNIFQLASHQAKYCKMKTTTFLTFVNEQCGKAEEAMNFYISLFPNSKVDKVINFADGEPGGTPELIKYAEFSLNGTPYILSENNYKHAWSFSPGISILVECYSDDEITTLFEQLSSNQGKVLMPLDHYDLGEYAFGKKFGWCEDRYGISWQVRLAS